MRFFKVFFDGGFWSSRRGEGREYWMHKWRIFVTNQDLEESGSEERIAEAVK